jgi:hypothetical protein
MATTFCNDCGTALAGRFCSGCGKEHKSNQTKNNSIVNLKRCGMVLGAIVGLGVVLHILGTSSDVTDSGEHNATKAQTQIDRRKVNQTAVVTSHCLCGRTREYAEQAYLAYKLGDTEGLSALQIRRDVYHLKPGTRVQYIGAAHDSAFVEVVSGAYINKTCYMGQSHLRFPLLESIESK